jgi:hypothetical protein
MERSIGGLWLKDGKNGKFMSGNIDLKELAEQTSETEKIPIIIFKNDRKKEGENTPDYRIFLGKPKEKQEPIPEERSELEPF